MVFANRYVPVVWYVNIAMADNDAHLGNMTAGGDNTVQQAEGDIVGRDKIVNNYFLPNAVSSPQPIPPKEEPKAVFYVPRWRNDYFTGRDVLLQQMQENLHAGKVVALHGLGGIGKTQTLVEYAHRQRADYTAVLWLTADTPENLSLHIRAVALDEDALHLPLESHTPPEQIKKAVIEWLRTHSSWLLLIDNADELELVKVSVTPANAGIHKTTPLSPP